MNFSGIQMDKLIAVNAATDAGFEGFEIRVERGCEGYEHFIGG